MNANELADWFDGKILYLWDAEDGQYYDSAIASEIVPTLRQQQAEIEALKAGKIRAYDNGVEDGRKPDTNNEPVAWMDYLEHSDVYDLNVSGRGIPLYTHPVNPKYDPETGEPLIDGYPLFSGLPHPVKELTDEEINVVAILQDAEIVPVGHEIWKTGEEFNKYKRIVLATTKALRKAQE